MMNAHDGYTITFEAEFKDTKVGQAVCLHDVSRFEGTVAICGERMPNRRAVNIIPPPFDQFAMRVMGGNPTVTEIVNPISPHKLTREELRVALERKLGEATS